MRDSIRYRTILGSLLCVTCTNTLRALSAPPGAIPCPLTGPLSLRSPCRSCGIGTTPPRPHAPYYLPDPARDLDRRSTRALSDAAFRAARTLARDPASLSRADAAKLIAHSHMTASRDNAARRATLFAPMLAFT